MISYKYREVLISYKYRVSMSAVNKVTDSVVLESATVESLQKALQEVS